MRGSWDLGSSCTAATTACGRKTVSPSRDCIHHIFPTESHVQNIRSFEHASSRSPSRENASMVTRFSVRVITHERHFRCRASAYSGNFWTAITLELRTSLLAEDPHGSREAFFVFVFSVFFSCVCPVLNQVEISAILQFPDQHK